MSHGIARLSQRLRRKIGSDSATKSTKKLRPRPNGQQQAGPATGSCRDLTTAQPHPDDDDHHHQQHCQLGSHLHESASFSSSIPAGYLSSAEDLTGGSRGAAASSITHKDQTPNEEGPSGQQRIPDDTEDVGVISNLKSVKEPPPLSSTVDDRATASLGQSALLATTADTTCPPTTPSISFAKPPSRRIPSSETSTSTSASFLQTVHERDGASPAAVGSDDNDTVEELPPGQNPSTSHSTAITTRKQSLVPQSQQYLVNRVLGSGPYHRDSDPFALAYHHPPAPMAQRKIWVKRPDASATLVSMSEDSVVDELRDHVLRKYSNSLGRTYDSPDLTVRICPRVPQGPDRILSPEESLFALIDHHYPGGQTMAEALVVEAPQRRTPMKPSPRQSYYYHAEPGEQGEYFPLMPVPISVGTPPAHPSSSNTSNVSAHQTPSMSVLTTGKVQPLGSPGSRPKRHARRPPFARHPTGSPTLIGPAKGMLQAI